MTFSLPRAGARLVAVLVLVALVAPTAPALGQDQGQLDRYRLAQNYLRAGQFERAIGLLEDLYEQDRDAHPFYQKLLEAYEQSKRYDEAITLVDAKMDRQGRTSPLMAERARLLYLKGSEDEAFAAYDETIELAPDQRSTYLAVYNSLTQNRLFSKAVDVLERARARMGDDEAFQSALAQLYSITGAHEQAMREYVGWLQDDSRKLGLVRGRVSQFMETEEARNAYTGVLQQAVRDEPLYRPFRELLAWLHLESGQYREALDVTRAIDRLEDEHGAVLLDFARRAGHAGAYDVALDAYQDILARYPEATVTPQALLGLARMHEQWAGKQGERALDAQGNSIDAPHYIAALEAYREFLAEYPGSDEVASVLRSIGRLQQDIFRELDEAEATLDEVVTRYPDTEAAQRARYDLGRIALQRNKLAEARLAFSRLADALHSGELAEQARYELALLDFYQGAFESSLALVGVLDANTSTDVANDAISLKVLIHENRGPDSLDVPLERYARARLLQRQRRPRTAIDTLDGLLEQYGRHPIADNARFLRAQALRESGKVEDAVTAYLELPLIHPTSALADRSLFAAARLQEQVLDTPDEAVETYTRLLTEHPGSLLIPDVRTRIRALRGDTAS